LPAEAPPLARITNLAVHDVPCNGRSGLLHCP
jgi:hypothetical protein